MAKQSGVDETAAKKDERSSYQRWLDVLRSEADINGIEEPQFILDEVISGILDAPDMAAAFVASVSGPESGRSLIGKEVRVHADSVTIHHSTIADARFPFLVRAEVTRLEDGIETTMRVGAPNCVALLWKAREAGKLPIDVTVTGRDIGPGKVLLNLQPVSRRLVTTARPSSNNA
jgi:hypothetical protein